MDAILDAFDRYLEASTPENFLLLRQAVAQSPAYHPSDDKRGEAENLLQAEQWDAALRLLMSDMPNAFLTPRFHFLASFAAHKFGDEKKANVESAIGGVLIKAILASGDGTKERPFLVSRITDEYDVLQHLEKKLTQQSLVSDETGTFDHMECDDGTEYWFDVSMMFARLNTLNSGEQGEATEDSVPAKKEPWWKFGRN